MNGFLLVGMRPKSESFSLLRMKRRSSDSSTVRWPVNSIASTLTSGPSTTFQVRITRTGPVGVILTWNVVEGPLVSVEAIEFTGHLTVDESELRRFILSKENDSLFGLIPTSKNPFIERNLREDVERVKLYYRLEGWLDIQHGDHVFLEDLVFSEDKTRVTIKIHIEEGERYKIRGIRFEFDASSRRIFPEAEMFRWLLSKPGDPYTENNANKDVAKIRENYGEKAYIQAEINHNEIIDKDKNELDLVYSIKENEKIFVGRLIFEGNTKTREDEASDEDFFILLDRVHQVELVLVLVDDLVV